jgi:class 3 adenylate cyclase
MIEMVDLFNAERALEDKPAIAIGIGIATGEMVAGYTGTQRRATYTCVGDAVNLAARLEAQTKVARRPILIDTATRAALADGVAVEPIGAVAIKGMPAAIELYSVAAGGAT